MYRTAALIIASVLVVSGCGSPKPAPVAPTTAAPADHADAAAQTAVLSKALARFRTAGSGSYESQVTADGVTQPLAHETGRYRLVPAAARFERAILGIDQASSKPRVQVVRVRSVANTKSFLQVKEWGSWTGCWLKTDLAAITKLTGVAIAKDSPLPTAINILAKAKVVGAGGGMEGPHLAVDAYTALQFLGVAGSAIAGTRDTLAAVMVPVLLDVTADGGPSGAAVEGTQVLTVLKEAGTTISSALSAFVSKTHAQVVLADLGTAVRVTAPGQAELLPRHPAATATCAANR